ncbi:hypothetical protein F5J12DRAFT_270719 [Pisolithus orientalis]|uniref:uncharacterized protein n=1 Tax=Pisolithus orientalis TaxID=936130 RepID=UPI00222436CF|nr:uncharacterized protein F5J12DRAFT_270719 [Pisolithus orientalis]KAI5999870.1 hypothetical protein F5J12DRAFT_270719 [Pisolithus orientalis]
MKRLLLFSRIPRPLQRHRYIGLASFSIFLTAFILSLLVGLSLTIIKSIYLIKIAAVNSVDPVSNAATSLVFGVWGVCGLSASGASECYGPQLGYTIPSDILSLVGLSQSVATIAEKSLLVLLVLHLVSAALSTIVFVLSLYLHSHAVAIIALITAIVTALVSSFVFAVDVVLVVLVKSHIDSLFLGANFGVEFGNGVWMVLVAVVMTWIAIVILSARACYCLGVKPPFPDDE